MSMIIFNALQATLSGGIGRYAIELSRELYQCHNNIKIVIRLEDSELFDFVKSEDLIVVKGIDNGMKRNMYEQFKLPFLIKKQYPDALIHYPDSMAPIFATNKCIITVHDIAFRSLKNVFTWKTKLWKNISTYISLKKAFKIISISEYTKKELIKYYGENLETKITVIYNGFNDFSKDNVNKQNIRNDIKQLNNNDYILTVSTISPRKNIQGLIKSYIELRDRSNEDKFKKLVIAGAYGWLYEDIINMAKECKYCKDIIFTGKINDDELKYLYSNCNIFVYISFYEGFGLPPLEAMSFKKPCIVSNTSSIPEVVGEAALLVDPNNILQIENSINSLLINNKLYYNLSEIALKNVERFSWNKCAKETAQLYN